MSFPRSRRRRDLPPGPELEERIRCALCGRRFAAISPSHLVRTHHFEPGHPVEEYKARFRPSHTRSRPATEKLLGSVAARYDREGRGWSRVRVQREILRRWAESRSLRSQDVRTTDPSLEDAARGYFGSWRTAVRLSGLDYTRIRAYRRWEPSSLVEALRHRESSGESLREGAVMADVPALRSAARRIFGSWARALEAAGVGSESSGQGGATGTHDRST